MRGGKRLNRDALSLRGLYEWVQVLVCAVTATVLLFTFAARVVLVSGPSMRETLQHQDCLLVMNAHLCGGFEAGDIVIIRKESFKDGEPIVKRVIATEGQTVDIDYQTGTVYLPTSDPANPEKRSVTLGLTDGKMVEVKEGLTEGEEILEFTPTSNKDNQDGQTGPYGGMDSGMVGGPGGAAGTQ